MRDEIILGGPGTSERGSVGDGKPSSFSLEVMANVVLVLYRYVLQHVPVDERRIQSLEYYDYKIIQLYDGLARGWRANYLATRDVGRSGSWLVFRGSPGLGIEERN